ncbi:MAG: twin-arginine translocase subunit TatC [Myxococcota bacterium]
MSDGAVMTFQEHLIELRSRIVRVALALVLGFFVCWSFRVELFDLLAGPISRALADNGIYQYQAIQVTESIIVYLKTSFVFSVLLTSPYTFYQFWSFISPAMQAQEKEFIIPVTAFTVIFFLIGAAFSYQVILPFVTDWLTKLSLEGGQVEVMVTLQNAYSTSFVFLLMFGLVFELPLVIFFLSLFQIVTARGLIGFFRYFVVLSVIIGAILTPPDPISQALMAIPLNILYAFGILIAWGVERSRENAAEGETPNAGLTLMRLMGSSLLLLTIAGGLIGLFIESLPQRDLVHSLPIEARYAIGGNPSVLASEAAVQEAMRDTTTLGAWGEALSSAGIDPATCREAAVVGMQGDTSALILRASGLGARAGAVEGLSAATLDEETIAIGDEAAVEALRQTALGERDALVPTEEEGRLLTQLRTTGPLWVWLPTDEARPTTLTDPVVAKHAAAVGGSIHLGETPRLSFFTHAAGRESADALEAQLGALGRVVSAMSSSSDSAALLGVLSDLTAELEQHAVGSRKARFTAISDRLTALKKPDQTRGSAWLAPLKLSTTGWSLRRDDRRLVLTSSLDSDALRGVFARALALLE